MVPGGIADRKTAERAISFIAKPFTEYTEVDSAAMLGVDLAGFFDITQLAIAEMEEQRSGHVVQITKSLVDPTIAAVPTVLANRPKCWTCRSKRDKLYKRLALQISSPSPLPRDPSTVNIF